MKLRLDRLQLSPARQALFTAGPDRGPFFGLRHGPFPAGDVQIADQRFPGFPESIFFRLHKVQGPYHFQVLFPQVLFCYVLAFVRSLFRKSSSCY